MRKLAPLVRARASSCGVSRMTHAQSRTCCMNFQVPSGASTSPRATPPTSATTVLHPRHAITLTRTCIHSTSKSNTWRALRITSYNIV